MTIIGWTSERLAAAYCENCARVRWTRAQLARGHEGRAAYSPQLHPIFATDEIPDDWCCDDCFGILE